MWGGCPRGAQARVVVACRDRRLRRSRESRFLVRPGADRSVFFELFLEGHDLGLAARLEHFLAALIAEATVAEQAAVGTRAVPGDTEPQRNGTLKIGDGPELTAGGCRLGPKELTRRVLMEVDTDAGTLRARQLGAIATDPPIDQTDETSNAILSAPFQQAGAAASSNLADVGNGIAQSVEADGLVARAGGAIFGTEIRLAQLRVFRVGQTELSFCHA